MSSLKAETMFNALFHYLQYQPQSSQAHSWWELPDWPSPSTCIRVGLVANLLRLIFFFFFLQMKFYFNWESSMSPNLFWGHGSFLNI